jgi:molybdopterin-synthase adenylyltransferase
MLDRFHPNAEMSPVIGRYGRQAMLPEVAAEGQARLAAARVVIVGCGALGCVAADYLARAGVGTLRLIDRDVVELSNLGRQILFDQSDVERGLPKVIAAANRLSGVNGTITIEPLSVDLAGDNAEELLRFGDSFPDVIIDGSDNVQTRYLLNDLAVCHGVAFVYGACVGTSGRMMAMPSPKTACLRCVFPDIPTAGALPTCDTAGILGPAAGIVGALQAAAAIRFIVAGAIESKLLSIDAWAPDVRSIAVGPPDADCPCCGKREFEFLNGASRDVATTLCGRSTVQIRPADRQTLDLPAIARRLESAGQVQEGAAFVRCILHDPPAVTLTLFADGRLLVQGVSEPGRARSLYARFIGR